MTDAISYKIKGNQTGGLIDIGGRNGKLPVDGEGMFVVPAGVPSEVHARIRGAGHKPVGAPILSPPKEAVDLEEDTLCSACDKVIPKLHKFIEVDGKYYHKECSPPSEPIPEHAEVKSLRDILIDVKGVGPSLASKILDNYADIDEIAATTPKDMGEKIVGMKADLATMVIRAIKEHQARLKGA